MRYSLMRLMAVLSMGLSVLATNVATAASAAVEGQDYQALNPAQPTSNPGKIVVTEFFSYQCPHCYAFYPVVKAWAAKQPADVAFESVPVSLGHAAWVPVAQAYYALQAMGKLEQMDRLIFAGIHVQNAKLLDEASITNFVAKQGINAADFTAAYNSFGVKSSTVRGDQMMKSYRVQGTPTMVVDGKYIVLSEGTRNYDDLLARTDRVVAKARADRAARK